MRWDEIEAALPAGQVAELSDWRETYQREVDAHVADLHAFVRWLRDTGRIDDLTVQHIYGHQRAQGNSQAETLAATFLPEQLATQAPELVDAVSLDGEDEPELPQGPPLTLVGRLAAGAMGEILIVRERDLRRQVALKRMHPSLAKKPRLTRRFLHEAQITAQLDHPNIVPVYNLQLEEGTEPSYTMKLVRGKTFAQLVREARDLLDDGREPTDDLALETLLEHFVRACDAIAYAHSRGVVHRDLKPENIMVGAYGEVYVMDWGIARVMGTREGSVDAVQVEGSELHRTRLGAVLGTPAYMSPEQAQGRNDQLDGRSDVYSLGLILTELVTLRSAARDLGTLEVVGRRQAGETDPVVHHVKGRHVSRALVAIVERCTMERPRDRYPTASALADDVRRHLRGEPVSAYPETLRRRSWRWIAAHRVLALWLLVGLLSVAAGITIASMASTLYTVRAASWREAQLTALQSEVATRARDLDARFQELPGHLEALSLVTLQALSRRETPQGADSQYYLQIEGAPDLTPSLAYERPVSLDHPNTVLPLDVPLAAERELLQRLATLGPAFRRILVTAHPRDLGGLPKSARRRALLDVGGPVRWIYLALESGVGQSYPGHPGVPPGLDLRREPWYQAARDTTEVVWGEVRRATRDDRSLLPVSRAILDEDGFRIGVAALEIVPEQMVGGDLALPGWPSETRAWILDGEGRVLLSSEDPTDRADLDLEPRRSRWRRLRLYEDARILDALDTSADGHLELQQADGTVDLALWSRMGALGWTYLVRGPRDPLMP